MDCYASYFWIKKEVEELGMKKYLLMILSISILLICCSCSKDFTQSDDEITIGGDDYLYYFNGKIIKIIDENTVLVQVTKECGDYNVNDKVYVHYKEAFVRDKACEFVCRETDSDIIEDYKPIIGDEISMQYFPEENSQTLNDFDYIENAGPIYKYVIVKRSDESSSNS